MAKPSIEDDTSKLLSTQNPSNAYYIHHSDNPGAILVTQILTGENYASWIRAMLKGLSVKNKLFFISGSIEKSTTGTDLHNSWIRCNDMVISWILNFVSKDIAASLIYAETTLEIWQNLKEWFHIICATVMELRI